MTKTPPNTTPMLEQYWRIKQDYNNCLLLFRLGDFYELFFEDAQIAASVLDITLTKRGKQNDGDIPMCGIPAHASENYIARLIKQGHHVAICEQMESPEEAKKRGAKSVVRREVIRVITPGTLTEETLLEAKSHNFLLAISQEDTTLGLAWCDISTGDFFAESIFDSLLSSSLYKLLPKEILIKEALLKKHSTLLKEWQSIITLRPDHYFQEHSAIKRLKDTFSIASPESFGTFTAAELSAIGALLEYLDLTQRGSMPRLKAPKRVTSSTRLQIDAATRRNLELVVTLNGEKKGSLLSVVDKTVTPAGGRLLASHLLNPLQDLFKINQRLDFVEYFIHSPLRRPLREILSHSGDLERLLGRLTLKRGGPRDLGMLKTLLEKVENLKSHLNKDLLEAGPVSLQKTFKKLGSYPTLLDKLKRALVEDLPYLAREGGFIRAGFLEELDALKSLKDGGKQCIVDLQSRYIKETNIPSLKIRYNNILGYYIELTSSHKEKVPPHFIHRQSLINAFRYTTTELVDLEQKTTTAAGKALQLELRLFENLVEEILTYSSDLSETAQALANLDVALALAELAVCKNYTRPLIDDSTTLLIKNGRHPIVETTFVRQEDFMPNTCLLKEKQRIWLLTGPNMAGKSTFLRQNALIILLAQMGSFIPAEEAHIGIVDALFSRVGAADDLARGRSTFMVEMIETAAILNQATNRSFVILDEIGRGTATFDGLSIAWATLEYLAHHNKCRSLFATHYHELTDLEQELEPVECYTMKVKEWQGEIIFLHEIVEGKADQSYGIHVAKLAGLPSTVIQRAEEILKILEQEKYPELMGDTLKALPLFEYKAESPVAVSSAVEQELLQIDLDNLSPKEALIFLYSLKEALSQKKLTA